MKQISIVAIHGTFARRADWISANSAMHNHIARALEEYASVAWFDFRWSGANSSRRREVAAAELTIEIEIIRKANPASQLVLIGHSHGGNVAMLAAKAFSQEGGRSVSGVIAMSTPFVKVRRLSYERQKEIAEVGEIALMSPMSYLIVFGAGLLLAVWSELSFTWIGSALLYVVFFISWATAIDAVDYLKRSTPESFAQHQDRIAQKYSPSANDSPIFCIRTKMDEAFFFLGAVRQALLLPLNFLNVSNHALIVGFFWLVLIAFVLGGNLLWLLFLPALHAIAYFLGNSLRAGEFSLGEDPKDQTVVEFLVDVEPHFSKISWNRVVDSGVKVPLFGGLRHSSLYRSEYVFGLVCDFVKAVTK